MCVCPCVCAVVCLCCCVCAVRELCVCCACVDDEAGGAVRGAKVLGVIVVV